MKIALVEASHVDKDITRSQTYEGESDPTKAIYKFAQEYPQYVDGNYEIRVTILESKEAEQ